MEAYRNKFARRSTRQRFLIPVSGGVSSVALLEILDAHYQKQLEVAKGVIERLGYDLFVLFVDDSLVVPNAPTEEVRQAISEQWPAHNYDSIPLASIFDYAADLESILSATGIPNPVQQLPPTADLTTNETKLTTLLSTLPSSSSKSDIHALITTRLITAYARSNNFTHILWGDSDSRLAAKALSSVAKGRGFAVPWQVLDGPTSWEGIHFGFPMRDLYKFEIEKYAEILQPGFTDLVVKDQGIAEVATRNMSIDELLKNYIDTQGAKYPGIMANVVRTIGKLQAPQMNETKSAVKCRLCDLPIPRPGEEGETSGLALEVGEEMCYACTRSCFDPKSGITGAR